MGWREMAMGAERVRGRLRPRRCGAPLDWDG